jgi:hypothetical protein
MMNAAVTRLLKVVGDPTHGGTTLPPAAVQIPWAEWQEFVNEATAAALPESQAAGPQPLKKGVKHE